MPPAAIGARELHGSLALAARRGDTATGVGVGREALAIALGACLYALALPPFDLSAAGWVVLVPLLVTVHQQSTSRALLFGGMYGVACAAAVTWWLAAAAAQFFGLPLVVAGFALWAYSVLVCGTSFGLFAAATTLLLRRGRSQGAFVAVAALWVLTEYFRARLVGQPWGLLGYTQHTHPALLQIAAAAGVYGVSFLLAWVNAALATGLLALHARRPRSEAARPILIPAAFAGLCWVIGASQLQRPDVDAVRLPVAIVQTNMPPALHWTRAYAERQIAAHVEATRNITTSSRPTLIVWPENAVPRYIERDPGLAAALGRLAVSSQADIVLGAPLHENGRTYNAAHLVTAAGTYRGAYRKRRLVPFAEASPLQGPPPAEADESPHAFSAGTQPGILTSFARMGITICHEIFYPELVRADVRRGAQMLVTIANDGWLDQGYGIASRQAFAMAKFRAVETRRYLLRAATTGVSGVVDPYGRTLASLPPGVAGIVTAGVGTRSGLSTYARYGDVFLVFGCVLLVVARAAIVIRPALRAFRSAPA